MKVSLLGSTGLVGKELLRKLVNCKQIEKIYTFSRTEPNIKDKKITQFIDKNFSLNTCDDEFFKSDAMVCCLGSTIKKAKTKEEFKRIDHDLPFSFAKNFNISGGQHFVLLSAIGANKDSLSFYSRTKGEVEESIINLNFKKTSIIRPSLLVGERQEKRRGEEIAQKLAPIFDKILIGSLERFKSVKAIDVAQHLLRTILNEKTDRSIESIQIKRKIAAR